MELNKIKKPDKVGEVNTSTVVKAYQAPTIEVKSKDLVKSNVDSISEIEDKINSITAENHKIANYANMPINDFIEHVEGAKELSNSIFRDMNKRVYYHSKDINIFQYVENNQELEDLIKIDYPKFTKNKMVGKEKQIKTNLPNGFISKMKQFNTINILKKRIDFFQVEPILVRKQGAILEVIKNDIEYKNLKFFDIDEATHQNILKEYREQWKDNFDSVLEWIVNCRFSNSRRQSFLHLRVNAGFGKSFFKSILKDLGLFVESDYSDFQNPSPLDPALFDNSIGLVIDEFTIFKQEFKKLTHEMSLSAKYQLKTEVPLYAKIFMSAEDSPSFINGVDKQITDRVCSLDFNTQNLQDLPYFKKYGNVVYYNVIKQFIYDYIKKEIDKFRSLGEVKSSNQSDIFLADFHKKNSLKSESLEETLKDVFYTKLNELVHQSQDSFTIKDRDMFKKLVITDTCIYIKTFKGFFEEVIKSGDENFYKKARYKTNNIEEILGVENKSRKIEGDTVRCVKIDKKLLRKFIEKDLIEENNTPKSSKNIEIIYQSIKKEPLASENEETLDFINNYLEVLDNTKNEIETPDLMEEAKELF